MYDRNGPGDRVDGPKTIDPDGTYISNTPVGPNHGTDNPIVTYCDMSNGGWTPAIYMNSENTSPRAMRDDRNDASAPIGITRAHINWDPNRASWALDGRRASHNECTTDAQCNEALCPTHSPNVGYNWNCPGTGTAKCQLGKCMYTATYTGLPAHPQNYSVAKAPLARVEDAYPPTYVMDLQQSALAYTTEFKWQVYRHGQLLHTIGPFAREMRMPFGRYPNNNPADEYSGNGWLYTPSTNGPHWYAPGGWFISLFNNYPSARANIHWLRVAPEAMLSPYQSGYDPYGYSSNAQRVNGWLGQPPTYSLLNVFSGSHYSPNGGSQRGFWAFWGERDQQSAIPMGTCNDLSTPCGYSYAVKRGTQSVLSNGESSLQPGYGGEYHVSGLVFVLWTK